MPREYIDGAVTLPYSARQNGLVRISGHYASQDFQYPTLKEFPLQCYGDLLILLVGTYQRKVLVKEPKDAESHIVERREFRVVLFAKNVRSQTGY